jgi:hypothetical protein
MFVITRLMLFLDPVRNRHRALSPYSAASGFFAAGKAPLACKATI